MFPPLQLPMHQIYGGPSNDQFLVFVFAISSVCLLQTMALELDQDMCGGESSHAKNVGILESETQGDLM